MTTASSVYPQRNAPKALIPWLFSIACQQWKAWQVARRAVRADELSRNFALQDAQMLAAQSRAMQAAARRG
ncbi:MAG: hypothetical protein ACI4QS_01185 [Comamonas sp.]